MLFATLMLASCKHKVAPADTSPPDRLGELEYPEGKEVVLGITLPLDSQIAYRYGSDVVANTRLTPEQLANFVKARIKGGAATRGATSTIFDNVNPNKEPSRFVRVEIRPAHVGKFQSELHLLDVTPIPLDRSVSEEERWRRVGLTPDGKPIDRKNMN